ncbi:MAG: asparaginyl/glutamyl-tRNA amidotransferase subunit C [Omnitrophica WOR_2 bacterium GWA2_47_8]|nr:MAG: asparaginyl/glutamyl-tRNA amidotransferase subunit C [Omnitrophica WOR_2 bacterium GWA2_47_8]
MISKKDVYHIASLARIHLDESEIESLTKNLEGILHYIAKLEKLNVKDVQPTSHVLELKNVFREDAVKPSLKQSEAVSITPNHLKGSFKVPLVIE